MKAIINFPKIFNGNEQKYFTNSLIISSSKFIKIGKYKLLYPSEELLYVFLNNEKSNKFQLCAYEIFKRMSNFI